MSAGGDRWMEISDSSGTDWGAACWIYHICQSDTALRIWEVTRCSNTPFSAVLHQDTSTATEQENNGSCGFWQRFPSWVIAMVSINSKAKFFPGVPIGKPLVFELCSSSYSFCWNFLLPAVRNPPELICWAQRSNKKAMRKGDALGLQSLRWLRFYCTQNQTVRGTATLGGKDKHWLSLQIQLVLKFKKKKNKTIFQSYTVFQREILWSL